MPARCRGVEEVEPSMKVPPKRKGNKTAGRSMRRLSDPSMKVPPKRKGNPTGDGFLYTAPGSPQ